MPAAGGQKSPYPEFHGDFVDRSSVSEEFVKVVPPLWEAYLNKSERTFHPFICVFTGSGMGKTRFGYEMPSKLREGMCWLSFKNVYRKDFLFLCQKLPFRRINVILSWLKLFKIEWLLC